MPKPKKRTGIFGDDLRAVRHELGLTQEQMARRFNIAFSTYARWELGLTLPARVHRPKLARLLGVKILEFKDD